MNHVWTAALTTLAIATLADYPAIATPVEPIAVAPTTQPTPAITPADLAFLAYRGELTEQNIPGYSHLVFASQLDRVTAEDVVAAATVAGYLAEAVLENDRYINAVQAQLHILEQTY